MSSWPRVAQKDPHLGPSSAQCGLRSAAGIGLATLYLLHAGKSEEALTRLRETVEVAPDAWLPHVFLATALVEKGMFVEAVDEARAAHAINPSGSQPLGYAGFAQAKSGERAAARATLQDLLQPSSPRYISPYPIAMIYNG